MERKKIYSRHIKKIKSLWTPPIRPLCPGLWLTLPGGRSYSRKFKRQEKKWSQRPSTIHWHVSLLRTHKPRILGKGWKSNSISVSGYLYIWKKKKLNHKELFQSSRQAGGMEIRIIKTCNQVQIFGTSQKGKYWKSFSEEILSHYFAWYIQIVPVFLSACSIEL